MAYPDHTDRSYASLVSLAGRRAVVTGAAAGLGRQIATRLLDAGASVVVADLDEAAAQKTAADLSGPDRHAVGARVDVADGATVEALADTAVAELGGIDVWVNNAGVYPRGSILDIDHATWRRVMAINLDGAYYGAKAAAQRMVDAGAPGVIVNIVSTAAFDASGGGNGAHYVASKHAVAGLTKSIAVQLADHGVRAVAIAPTLSRTQGMAADLEGEQAAFFEGYAAVLPARRIGVPDDVARVVVFAASDAAAFVSGSTIAADGGDLAV